MKKPSTRTMVLMGILGVVIVYYLIDSGVFSPKLISEGVEDLGGAIGVSGGPEQDVGSLQDIALLANITELEWNRDWEEDPFFYISPETLKAESKAGFGGLIGGGGKVAGMSLTGISWLGNSGYAIINGSIVAEGETIGGYTVDKISLNYVILKQGLQTVRLSLNE